jgi:hypothetical protein
MTIAELEIGAVLLLELAERGRIFRIKTQELGTMGPFRPT